MIQDRYEPLCLFDLVPQLQLRFEPELAVLDRLPDAERLLQQVKADLARRYRRTARTGRPATPVEVVLRLLVAKHLYGWSYEATSASSPTAPCCGSSAAWGSSRSRTTRPCCAGPTVSDQPRCTGCSTGSPSWSARCE